MKKRLLIVNTILFLFTCCSVFGDNLTGTWVGQAQSIMELKQSGSSVQGRLLDGAARPPQQVANVVGSIQGGQINLQANFLAGASGAPPSGQLTYIGTISGNQMQLQAIVQGKPASLLQFTRQPF